MSHTETKEVTYLGGHRVRVGGRVYQMERTARIEVSHGTHGPVPRFEGDCWTIHHVCSACGGSIDRSDAYCRHCGSRIIGIGEPWDE